jgi:outer membrane biosynthesis protein TonB
VRGPNRKRALAAAAAVTLVAAGCVSAGYGAPAGPTDTTPPPETTPAPDPAPPLPKPKPAPRPAAPVYHPPVHHSTPAPAPQPTYTPPTVVHHAVKKKVVHHRKPVKRVKRLAPKAHVQIKPASIVPVAAVPTASVAAKASKAGKNAFVIFGFGLAALMFLLVVTVPATVARFTPPGRVLMDHQFQLVLLGVGVLLLTALLFAVSGNT